MFLVVQSLSRIQLFAPPWTAARQASLSFTISQSLLKLMSIESVMPSNHLSSVIPFSSCLQSFAASEPFLMSILFPSGGQILELQLQHLSFQYSGLISFRIDWFNLLVVQGSLKSLLQHQKETIDLPNCPLAKYQIPRLTFSLSVQFSSVTQSCPTLCEPKNCSTPGLPVHHQLLDFTCSRRTGCSD